MNAKHVIAKRWSPVVSAVVMGVTAFLPVSGAASLSVQGSGFTVGALGTEVADVQQSLNTVALESIQNGTAHPPEATLEASVLGAGFAYYGRLGGSITAQVRNMGDSPNFFEPMASGNLRLGFLDTAIVTSATLPQGTPVVLNFELSLAAASFTTSPGVDNGANIGIEVNVKDTVSQQSVTRFTYNNTSAGPGPASQLFTLPTQVGRELALSGQMEIGAIAKIFGLPGDVGGDILRTSSALASQTGYLFYTPSGDVTLVGSSGHDYSSTVVPLPPSAWMLLTGIAALLAPRFGLFRKTRLHNH